MNPECRHSTFAERHPFVNPNAQKTNRLIERILKTSSEMSSVCSSRLLKSENIIIGKSSICTLLKKTPLIIDKSKVYRVCIDDFALKKRYSYGTVMVDWDTHKIIDMVPSRLSIEVSIWLSTYDRQKQCAENAHYYQLLYYLQQPENELLPKTQQFLLK